MFGQQHKLIRMRIGKRAKEDGIDDREDGGIGADAEGESKNRDKSKARRLAESSQRVADVLAERLKHEVSSQATPRPTVQ